MGTGFSQAADYGNRRHFAHADFYRLRHAPTASELDPADRGDELRPV